MTCSIVIITLLIIIINPLLSLNVPLIFCLFLLFQPINYMCFVFTDATFMKSIENRIQRRIIQYLVKKQNGCDDGYGGPNADQFQLVGNDLLVRVKEYIDSILSVRLAVIHKL